MSRVRECAGCDKTGKDVEAYKPYWTAGGHNCSQLAWYKHRTVIYLCEDCLDDSWRFCDGCGVLVSGDYWGAGYLPHDYDGEPLCPTCGKKWVRKMDKTK